MTMVRHRRPHSTSLLLCYVVDACSPRLLDRAGGGLLDLPKRGEKGGEEEKKEEKGEEKEGEKGRKGYYYSYTIILIFSSAVLLLSVLVSFF